MNKKQYISPSLTVEYAKVQTYLHSVSNTKNNMAAPDLGNGDVGLSGALTLDTNEGGSDVSFGKERGDNGPWESLW